MPCNNSIAGCMAKVVLCLPTQNVSLLTINIPTSLIQSELITFFARVDCLIFSPLSCEYPEGGEAYQLYRSHVLLNVLSFGSNRVYTLIL